MVGKKGGFDDDLEAGCGTGGRVKDEVREAKGGHSVWSSVCEGDVHSFFFWVWRGGRRNTSNCFEISFHMV